MADTYLVYTFILANNGQKIVDNLNQFIIQKVEVKPIPPTPTEGGGFAHEILTTISLPVKSDVGFPVEKIFNVFGIKIDQDKVTVSIKGQVAKNFEQELAKVLGKIANEELKELITHGKIAKNVLHNPLVFGKKANKAIIEALTKGKIAEDLYIGKEIKGKKIINLKISYLCKGEKRNEIEIAYKFKGKKSFEKFWLAISDDEDEE